MENYTLEDIFNKILEITPRPDMLELEYDLKKTIYVGGICLDDHEESDIYDFNWEIGKKFNQQPTEVKFTINSLLTNN
jgi:hypothetical protein